MMRSNEHKVLLVLNSVTVSQADISVDIAKVWPVLVVRQNETAAETGRRHWS